jgi:integrase
VRQLAYEAADAGLLSPELAAGIHRVKGVRKLGSRLGNWLTAEEASALWQLPDGQTLTGKRNRAILAILLGCGLRRRELAELAMERLQRREDRWAIVDLIGRDGAALYPTPHMDTVPRLHDATLETSCSIWPKESVGKEAVTEPRRGLLKSRRLNRQMKLHHAANPVRSNFHQEPHSSDSSR